jgi:uncharacterized membrane-anchored protein
MVLPADHPMRIVLNDEVHARPPQALGGPCRLSYVALLCPPDGNIEQWRAVAELARGFDLPVPEQPKSHYSADFGAFRLVFEQHAEFAGYTFTAAAKASDTPFETTALARVPPEWLAGLPGRVITATHVALAHGADGLTSHDVAQRFFSGNQLVGSTIAGTAATALTDFRIHEDGFGRLLVSDSALNSRQAGRMVQRLLEIDTYRMMALLALPVAREMTPFLAQCERELTGIATALVTAKEPDEPGLLDRLTALESAIAGRGSDSYYRFGAAAAYYDLVQRRILELREDRLRGLQTFHEFIERRLGPAMNTCRSVGARQQLLSSRTAQATQLLATRVGVTRERQNLAILRSMNYRAALQLRLQSLVEGVSIAAVAYYVAGVVGYAAKAMSSAGIHVNAELAQAISIPVVVVLMALGFYRIHRLAERRPPADHT